jgi:hypothetical protein
LEYQEVKEDFPIAAGPPRSPGLHVSDIYGDMMRTLYNEPDYNDNDLWAYGGFVWEELLSIAWKVWCLKSPQISSTPKTLYRPDEIYYDGIYLSPDGLEISPLYIYLNEYKFTWAGAKTPPCKVWKWMVQIQAYLKAIQEVKGCKDLLTCRMRIFYVNGYYRPQKHGDHPFKPVYRCCLITFTQEEIDANWDMLKQHALQRGMIKL